MVSSSGLNRNVTDCAGVIEALSKSDGPEGRALVFFLSVFLNAHYQQGDGRASAGNMPPSTPHMTAGHGAPANR